jgi:DnaJ-class molecular chaperone
MSELCPKCKGTGVVREKDGSVHTCWDCLQNGQLDVHSDSVPDSKVKV